MSLRKSLAIASLSTAILTFAVWQLRDMKRSYLANHAASIKFLEQYCRGLRDELKSKYKIELSADSCKATHADAGPVNFYVHISREALLTVVMTPSTNPDLDSIHKVVLSISNEPEGGVYRLK